MEQLSGRGLLELNAQQQLEVLNFLMECVQESSVFISFVSESLEQQLQDLEKEKERLLEQVQCFFALHVLDKNWDLRFFNASFVFLFLVA